MHHRSTRRLARFLTDWHDAEERVRAALGLALTPSSGNKWYAPGDSVSTDNSDLLGWMVDSKSTVKKSYSVQRDWVRQYRDKALEFGKVFGLHIQFQDDPNPPEDYFLMQLDDFTEMVNKPLTPRQVKAKKSLQALVDYIKDETLREHYQGALDDLIGGRE